MDRRAGLRLRVRSTCALRGMTRRLLQSRLAAGGDVEVFGGDCPLQKIRVADQIAPLGE
jgi:hypothetical protein